MHSVSNFPNLSRVDVKQPGLQYTTLGATGQKSPEIEYQELPVLTPPGKDPQGATPTQTSRRSPPPSAPGTRKKKQKNTVKAVPPAATAAVISPEPPKDHPGASIDRATV